jgi:hypothetical protein
MSPVRSESGGTVRKRTPGFLLIRIARAVAVAGASASIIGLTALSVGGVAALADPTSSTTTPPPTPISTTARTPRETPASTSESPRSTPSSPAATTSHPDFDTAPDLKTSLTLSLQQGAPGTQVTITAVGYGLCTQPTGLLTRGQSVNLVFSLQWDGVPVDRSHASTDGRDVVVPYNVPADAAVRDYLVTASCGDAHNSATFTVVAAKKEPTLKLDTPTGHRGSEVTASGTKFACGSSESVQLLWDGQGDPLAEAPPEAFTVTLTVPAETAIGGHTVVARCQHQSTITASQSFEVMKAEPPAVTRPPTLATQPISGRPGDQMRVAGERFACANGTVELAWDDGTRLADTPVDASGGFGASIPVPANTNIRGDTVRAACSDGTTALTAAFTVIVGTPLAPLPPPHTGIWGWVIALILVVAAVLVVRQIRQRRHPHQDARVHAVAGRSVLPVTTVHERPAHGEATHAIRLEAHFDSGTQTIREVNDDHTSA